MPVDPPEDLEFFLTLTLASSKAWRIVNREFRAVGVDAPHWGLLFHIAAHESATPSRLAAETGISATTMRDQLQALVDWGSIERTPNPLDARSYVVGLTRQGRRELKLGLAASKRAQKLVGAKFGQLEPLRRELFRFGRAAESVNADAQRAEQIERVRSLRG